MPDDNVMGNEELIKLNGDLEKVSLLSHASVAEYLGYTTYIVEGYGLDEYGAFTGSARGIF